MFIPEPPICTIFFILFTVYRTVTYDLVHEISEFDLNTLNGDITTKKPPYPVWHRFVLYMTAKDNDPSPDKSL